LPEVVAVVAVATTHIQIAPVMFRILAAAAELVGLLAALEETSGA
jgi:hypothetical protein